MTFADRLFELPFRALQIFMVLGGFILGCIVVMSIFVAGVMALWLVAETLYFLLMSLFGG